ncbi:MAG: hypothetical protein MJY42_01400 [Bacteroidales bacterium]|nr:hypothetical protein [Bacteroidales bacterium]
MKKVLVLITMALLMVSCHVSRNPVSASFQSPVQFMKTDGDGSITVRATGIGRNYNDALDQARKLALQQLVFKGIEVPGNAFLSKPLITEVNAEEKYQDFFNMFFADGGDYRQFVSAEDKRVGSTVEKKGDAKVKQTVTVRLLRPELKQYLIDHKVIKQ